MGIIALGSCLDFRLCEGLRTSARGDEYKKVQAKRTPYGAVWHL